MAGKAGSEAVQDALDDTLRALAQGAAVLGYAAAVALIVVHQNSPRWPLYAAPAILALGGLLALAVPLGYRRRALLLAGAMLAAAAVANAVSPSPYLALLYSTPVLAVGVLLGPVAATAFAVAGVAATLGGGAPGEQTLPALGFIGLNLALVWAALGNVFLALRRAAAGEARAWRYAGEANQRRGELARTKKALTDMYGLLERTNYELAVARQEAEDARHIKAQFAANISHELRTPLNLIVGFSEMIYRSPEVYGNVRWTPALSADIREIHRSSRHLLGMIDDILDLSRIEAQRLPLRLESTDVGELVREAAATVQGLVRGKDVAVEVDLAPALPEVLVDRTRIRQVLLNLLNNAIRFTDHGRIVASARASGGEVIVSVSDTGVGIPPAEMAAIFEEFGQAKGEIVSGRGGAGLGLAICRQFVRLHGGQVEAESEVGRGSTFRFRLPLPESGRARSRLSYYAPEGWSPPMPENPMGKTALVLAPDLEAAGALARTVPGYRALPLDSLDGLGERVEAEHPDGIVLLCDPFVPQPYTADDVWRAAGRADLPVIRCELPLEGVVQRELGVADYLVKPVERERLVEAITRACPTPRHILVVDDDPGFVALIGRIIHAELEGARVRRAYSGEEALAALAEHDFDLVLLDLVMARADGLEVIEAMRREERLARVPIVVTTGSGYGEEVARLRPAKVDLLRYGGTGRGELGRYVKALLEAAPPDYSRPAPLSRRPASVAESRAS